MKVIGLTGTIGSGKSTVAKILKQHGFTIINADKIGHALLGRSRTIKQKVCKVFGTTRRSKLAKIVFNDRSMLLKLNKIMHPAMKKVIRAQLHILKRRHITGIVVEAAVFIEMKLSPLVDELWGIVSPANIAQKRLRHKYTVAEFRARQNNATPLKLIRKYSDQLILNKLKLRSFEEKIKKLLKV